MPKYKQNSMAQKSSSHQPGTEGLAIGDAEQSENLVPAELPHDSEPADDSSTERRQVTTRRDRAWRAFVYGNFRPRRRLSRRQADEHHFLFDWHEPRILYLALAVLLLSCTDALFTLNLLKVGANEGNAIMALMLDDSVGRFLAVKIGVTSLSLVTLVAVARRKLFRSFNVEHLLQVFCAGYVALIGYEIYIARYVFELSLPSAS
jgi:hypothetical protein